MMLCIVPYYVRRLQLGSRASKSLIPDKKHLVLGDAHLKRSALVTYSDAL